MKHQGDIEGITSRFRIRVHQYAIMIMSIGQLYIGPTVVLAYCGMRVLQKEMRANFCIESTSSFPRFQRPLERQATGSADIAATRWARCFSTRIHRRLAGKYR